MIRLADLQQPGVHVPEIDMTFANRELAGNVQPKYDRAGLCTLEALLQEQGTFAIPRLSGHTVKVDGIERDVELVPATETNGTNHGEMSSMLYLRDQIQVASTYIELALQDPDHYSEEAKDGRTLLLSVLHLMSTTEQLRRFDKVIELGPEAGQEQWPQISLFDHDLEGTEDNGWRNIQDTFQMLAYTTLDTIERSVEHGYLKVEDLAEDHKKFLSSIVPLLDALGPVYETSGSWEEVAAGRTSVLAIETALLHKIQKLAESDPAFDFLAGDSKDRLDEMVDERLQVLGGRLPFESPEYKDDPIKYREADAALVYVLRYGLPQLLADAQVPIGKGQEVMSEEAIETLVLEQIATLIDPETGGISRYKADSYQRTNFHTRAVQLVVNGIKTMLKRQAGKGFIDLDKKQALRDELTPNGRPAAWVHPVFQLSSWASHRSLALAEQDRLDEAAHYRELATGFLNAGLSRVTGDNQWHAVLNGDGEYHIRKVPPGKVPECDITYELGDGRMFVVPSPHTPLNWGTATAKEAVGMLRLATPQTEAA
jgi:hypothetical protein